MPLIYLVIGLTPLLTQVGRNLEYEYALLTTWLTLATLPLLGLRSSRTTEESKPVISFVHPLPFSRSIPLILAWIFLVPVIFTMGPGTLLLWSQLCLCSPAGFYFWMIILWYPTLILAQAAAFAMARLRTRGVALRYLLALWAGWNSCHHHTYYGTAMDFSSKKTPPTWRWLSARAYLRSNNIL